MSNYIDELTMVLYSDGFIESKKNMFDIQWKNNTLKVNGQSIEGNLLDKYLSIKERYTTSNREI